MARVVKSRADSSRSRPVSCTFCRSRKLRCSRNFPCTNCISRGLDCPQDDSLPSAQASCSTDIPPSVDENVLARLRLLEDIVLGQGGTPPMTSNGSSMHAGSPPSHASPGSFARKFDRYKRLETSPSSDVDWLEGEITHPPSTVCISNQKLHSCQFVLTRRMVTELPAFVRD
jgi:hypothetical protein